MCWWSSVPNREEFTSHTYIWGHTHTPPPLLPWTIRADTKQLLPDGLKGKRDWDLSGISCKETVTQKTRVLKEKCPLCKARKRVDSLFLCQLPNLVIASISLSPWRAANCLWNGLVIPALVTLSGRPPHGFIILQRKMCFLTSVLHLFSFNFLQFPSPPPQIAHLCCSEQGGMSSASPTTLPILNFLFFCGSSVLHGSQVQKDREGHCEIAFPLIPLLRLYIQASISGSTFPELCIPV